MLSLPADEVHIWTWPAEPDEAAPQDGEALLLDEQEQQRMARYRFAHDRRRFLLRHQTVRRLLARYTGLAASSLRFEFNSHGKPRLASDHAPPHLHFSLSHSRHLVALALARGREVGVDIEHLNPRIALLKLATGCFALPEIAALRSVPPAQQLEAFFRIWTLKEAFIKANGLGLSMPLKSFAVTPGPPPGLISPSADHGGKHWQFGQWQVAEESCLAVALQVEPDHPPLRFVVESL